jgi:hypothetical protein
VPSDTDQLQPVSWMGLADYIGKELIFERISDGKRLVGTLISVKNEYYRFWSNKLKSANYRKVVFDGNIKEDQKWIRVWIN